jgi:hypothetical protein
MPVCASVHIDCVGCEPIVAVSFEVVSNLNFVWCDVVNDEAGTELAQV